MSVVPSKSPGAARWSAPGCLVVCCSICQVCRLSLPFSLRSRGVLRLHRQDSLFAAVCRDAFSRLSQLACQREHPSLACLSSLAETQECVSTGWGLLFLSVCPLLAETRRATSPQLAGVSKNGDYNITLWVRLAQERMLMVTARLRTSSSQVPVTEGIVELPSSRAPVTVISYQLLRTIP